MAAVIAPNYNCENLQFKPMILSADEEDTSFLAGSITNYRLASYAVDTIGIKLSGIISFKDWAKTQTASEVNFYDYLDHLRFFDPRNGNANRLVTQVIGWQGAMQYLSSHDQTLINYPLTEDGILLMVESSVMLIGGWSNIPDKILFNLKWGNSSAWKGWVKIGTDSSINSLSAAVALKIYAGDQTTVDHFRGVYFGSIWSNQDLNKKISTTQTGLTSCYTLYLNSSIYVFSLKALSGQTLISQFHLTKLISHDDTDDQVTAAMAPDNSGVIFTFKEKYQRFMIIGAEANKLVIENYTPPTE